LATTAKQSRFKEVVLLAQETAAVEEEGETQAMLFALLQKQHDKQMEIWPPPTKQHGRHAGTDERPGPRRRRQAEQEQQRNKMPPARNSTPTNNGTKKPKQKKYLCPNCKTFVNHSPEKCYELEANKDTRYPGWKSVHAVA
jgi:hypothetical protein